MAKRSISADRRAKPGAALKAVRIQRGLTLAEVSEKTGLTISALSKIENDKMAVSLENLLRIGDGLGVDIAQLIGQPQAISAMPSAIAASRRSVTRAGEGRVVEMARGNYVYAATDLLRKRMTPIVGEVFAKDIAAYDEYLHHPGEEYVLVISGTLDLHTDTYAPVRLEAGDSIYFDSTMGHAYVAVGDEPCRILSMCSNESSAAHSELNRASRDKTGASQPGPAVADAAEPPARNGRAKKLAGVQRG